MAVAAFGQANLIEDPNLFYAVAIVQPPHATEEVADTLIAEVEKLKMESITEHELQPGSRPGQRRRIRGQAADHHRACESQQAGELEPAERGREQVRRLHHPPLGAASGFVIAVRTWSSQRPLTSR